MTPFRPAGRTIFRVKVPNRNGAWRDCTTETRDPPTARAFQRMVDALGRKGRRDWEALEAVFYQRRTLGQLFDAYRMNDLDRFKAELADVDLAEHVQGWQAWLLGHVKPGTAERYLTHLRTLITGTFYRSGFTPALISRWLAGVTVQPRGPKSKALPRPANRATKRKYFAAAQSFVAYLLEVQALETSPLQNMTAPAANDPRPEFLELPEVRRLVERAQGQVRTLFALLYGTGCDLSPALELRRRDFDVALHEFRGRGEKAHNRDRVLKVADWAWGYIEPALKTLLPDAPLFPGLTRWAASDEHRRLLRELKLARPGLALRCSRHFWAVRALRAGTPLDVVARQMGHANGVLVLKVYGRFIASAAERQHWEKQTTKADLRREKAR